VFAKACVMRALVEHGLVWLALLLLCGLGYFFLKSAVGKNKILGWV